MKPFWEEEYLNIKRSVFGKQSKEVEEIVPLLKKDARILDAGCGDGRHAAYLASLGFCVDAFDISENAVNKLKFIKEKDRLNINIWVCDMDDFEFMYEYDLIIVHGVLQYIAKEKQQGIIEKLKRYTAQGGYNIIAVFTDEEPIPDDLKDAMVGVFREGEIKKYYADWETVMFQSYKFNDEHENGLKHCHALNKIIAKK
ncbi:MAG: methyltransferase domain-containing protein [Clostridia bacterium]|nr:methyltransferase domain-containing protein [Clostridia bacterium]MBR5265437.1 methyltransferase domain-containing protein [Clostridia bacterium]